MIQYDAHRLNTDEFLKYAQLGHVKGITEEAGRFIKDLIESEIERGIEAGVEEVTALAPNPTDAHVPDGAKQYAIVSAETGLPFIARSAHGIGGLVKLIETVYDDIKIVQMHMLEGDRINISIVRYDESVTELVAARVDE